MIGVNYTNKSLTAWEISHTALPGGVGSGTWPWAPSTPGPSLASGARAWPPRACLFLGRAAAWLLFLSHVNISGLALASAAWNPLVIIHCRGSRPLHGILVLGGFRTAGVSLSIVLLCVVLVTSSPSHAIFLPVLAPLVLLQVVLPWWCPARGAGTRAGPGVTAVMASITILCITLHPIFFLRIWWHLFKRVDYLSNGFVHGLVWFLFPNVFFIYIVFYNLFIKIILFQNLSTFFPDHHNYVY